MKLSYLEHKWELSHVFNLSVGKRGSTPVILLKIEHDGYEGFGEITLPPYLKEDIQSVKKVLDKVDLSCVKLTDKNELWESIDKLKDQINENYPTLAGLDIALHDLYSQKHQIEVHSIYDLDINEDILCSYTISYDKPSTLKEKLDLANQFKVLKMKMGLKYDVSFLKWVNDYSNKLIYADANQAWTSFNDMRPLLNLMEASKVVMIEQPFDKEDLEQSYLLKNATDIDIIADEACQGIEDLDRIKDAFDGINVKLMKCGGIKAAFDLITEAKHQNLKVMIGCMTSSSCAISAANNLSSLADYIDLDSAYLLKNEPLNWGYLENGILKNHSLEYRMKNKTFFTNILK